MHTNYRNVLEKIMVDHRKAYAEATATSSDETITAVATESANSELLATEEAEPELVWTMENDNQILKKFENEINMYEKGEMAEEQETHKLGEKEKEGDKQLLHEIKAAEEEEEKRGERMQAMMEEGVQKLGNALKESVELLHVGKAFLQNMKVVLENRKNVLMENRKNVLDQAKSLAGVVLENVSLQKKEKR